MKNEYIQEIIKLLQDCNDTDLLDLIFQLLKKRSTQF